MGAAQARPPALAACADREDFLESLLFAAEPHLAEPRVLSVHGGSLRGQIASTGRGTDRESVRQLRIELGDSPVLQQMARSREPFRGQPPPSDALCELCDPQLVEVAGVVVLPITVGRRLACVLVGHPIEDTEPQREALEQLARDASGGLVALIHRTRDHTSSFPAPEHSPEDLARLRAATSRDELVDVLLKAASRHLRDPVVHAVRADWMRALRQLRSDGADVSEMVMTRMQSSAAWAAVDGRTIRIETVREDDPLLSVHPGREEPVSLVPINVGNHPVLLLTGKPRGPVGDRLRLTLSALSFEAGMAIAKLISQGRHEGGRPRSRLAVGLERAGVAVAAALLVGVVVVLWQADTTAVREAFGELQRQVSASVDTWLESARGP